MLNQHSLNPSLFLKGGVNFDYLPLRRGGGSEKFKKGVEWKYGAGAGLLKRREQGAGLALFLFNFFKVYHFYI